MNSPATPGIAVVMPNPSLDRTAGLAELVPGAVNRAATSRDDPGGKGMMVAGYLADWQVPLALTGFLGRENARPFQAELAARGIADHFVLIDGASRTNIKIVEQNGQRVTDINFPGPQVPAAAQQDLLRVVGALAARYGRVMCCGSLPASVPADFYARVIEQARSAGALVALDTSGSPLAAALAARPDVIKPNGEELSEALGTPVETVAQAAEAAREMLRRGIAHVIVSLGPDGAVFAEARGVLHAVGRAPRLLSTVGAGDALLAGYMLGLLRGLEPADRARLATGFSLGALGMIGPHLPPAATVERLAASVRVTSIAV